ncbi:MAG: hypothetical protein RL346_2020 [Verrucomicrobiota bacterium]|jgi:hypothetical protein
MTRNIRIFSALALGWCIATDLAAQTPQTISVRTMALSEIEGPPLFFATGGEKPWVPVHWSRRQPSRPTVTLAPEGVLSLFQMKENPDGKTAYQAAHALKLSPNAKEILLFAWMAEGTLQLQPVDDDFLGKQHNRWLLINFSDKEIAFKVGDESKPIFLKSKTSELYSINVAENQPATILGQARIRGKDPKLFYSSYFPVKAGRRTIVLFTNDGDKIRTKLVIDHFLPDAAQDGNGASS